MILISNARMLPNIACKLNSQHLIIINSWTKYHVDYDNYSGSHAKRIHQTRKCEMIMSVDIIAAAYSGNNFT